MGIKLIAALEGLMPHLCMHVIEKQPKLIETDRKWRILRGDRAFQLIL